MAITKIHAIKGTLKKSIDYIMNPDKTDEKLLVRGLACSPEIADIEFKMTKDYFGKTEGNLAYHLVQAFKPGEVTEEKAHEIGIRLAEKVSKGKYQAVIASHVDKGHIHNHIIINSVSHLTGEKYNDCKNSYREIRNHSDELCEQYGLNVISQPKEKGKPYKEWEECRRGSSWKEIIRSHIDEAIKNSRSFEDFLHMMEERNYSIKRGKFISFKPNEKERYVRGKTLGIDYTEDSIKAKIALKEMGYIVSNYPGGIKSYRSNKNTFISGNTFKRRKSLLEINILLVISIMKEIAKKQAPTKSVLNRKSKEVSDAKVQKLANQLRFIRSENISNCKDLNELTATTDSRLKTARHEMKKLDDNTIRFDEVNKALVSYRNNKPFYDEVNESIFKKRKQKKYEVELRTFEYAKQKLQSSGIKSDVDIEYFSKKYQEHMEKVKRVRQEYEQLKVKHENCKKLNETIDSLRESRITGREEVKSRETKKYPDIVI